MGKKSSPDQKTSPDWKTSHLQTIKQLRFLKGLKMIADSPTAAGKKAGRSHIPPPSFPQGHHLAQRQYPNPWQHGSVLHLYHLVISGTGRPRTYAEQNLSRWAFFSLHRIPLCSIHVVKSDDLFLFIPEWSSSHSCFHDCTCWSHLGNFI